MTAPTCIVCRVQGGHDPSCELALLESLQRQPMTFFSCRMGRREPEPPRVRVARSYLDKWTSLGWSVVDDKPGVPTVGLAWRQSGEPVKPGRTSPLTEPACNPRSDP